MFYQIGCILSEVLDVDLENLRAVLLKASRSDAQVLLSPFVFSYKEDAWLFSWELDTLNSRCSKGNFRINKNIVVNVLDSGRRSYFIL